ncbi:chemotaxis protein CheA [Candidatus Nitrospira allomarina]|uniref:Chemotaxis protein CheA n=1 Tax=Candidatus Nitrospira allomarina TaxID=3020900 RepID=A0AA96G9A8_9BACT|nr:chemotaxis protein CheA [Candidatus Nitrospira allomarina]WNM56782.1 chemotaxis protein CheA [Candidatus Nitrospira allomarina]
MAVDLSRFQESFFTESAEHVETIESGLLALEQRPNDLDLLNRIFRGAHSIKGNAGMFHFTAIAELTHKMENILDDLRNEKMPVTPQVIDVLLRALDGLKSLLDAAQGGEGADETAIHVLEDELEACQKGATAPAHEGSLGETGPQGSPLQAATWRRVQIDWSALPELFQRGMDPAQIFKELHELGTVKVLHVRTDGLPALDTLDPERCYLSWKVELETDAPIGQIEEVFAFVRDGSELAIIDCEPKKPEPYKRVGDILVEEGVVTPEQIAESLAKQKPLGQILVEEKKASSQQVEKALQKQQQLKKNEVASIRVDTEKIDKLINLVGELVITQSMITDLSEKFTLAQLPVLQERITQLERNTREIQERVMSIRMMPIGSAFHRFPRLVRDLAGKSGKQIQLVMSGEETELDKTLIEAIGDPLTHLVRNSADHGLELPEDRVAQGKSERGTIRLHAYHDGGNICIAVEDDGRGLNREKIIKKAVEKGIIADGSNMSEEAVYQLIFRPGFSTAETITDVSGRGVGMDVVKRNIEGLGGSVDIQSTMGKGSRLTLKLPLTLAIIDGMTVRVGQDNYIIPLIAVTESIRPKPNELQRIVGKGEVVNLRGEWVPVVKLYEAFTLTPDFTDPSQALLVIVETDGRRLAVLVDELTGQQQVVIKSLEQNYRKVEAISGATILGDGQVALILDVPGLAKLARVGRIAAA